MLKKQRDCYGTARALPMPVATMAFALFTSVPFLSPLQAWADTPSSSEVLSTIPVEGASAHLIDARTLIWDGGKGQEGVALRTQTATITLIPTALSDAQKEKYPHLRDMAAFALPDGIDLKGALKGEVLAVATDSQGNRVAATQVQMTGALDDLYAVKAKTLSYGASVGDDGVTFRLWAPTAQSVSLMLYAKDKTPIGTREMAFDPQSGAWRAQGGKDLVGTYYRYAVTVFHPAVRRVMTYEVTDPYSLGLSSNSLFSQVVDLNDPALKPKGWDRLDAPRSQANPAQIVSLETHIRDFSARDASTPAAHRGKYLAFADANSVPVRHMRSLAKAGVTHLHLMPTFDIATVRENPWERADLADPVKKLCALNPALKESRFSSECEGSKTIGALLGELKDQDNRQNPVVQEFSSYLRGFDSFNWGYDPFHYTTPEGSYASDAEGMTRIKEFRTMIMAIKKNIGMNVVMDVVYNHTNAAGPESPYSVFDKIVPWYYNRLDEKTGAVANSTCGGCANTAPETAMFAKFITDSLSVWVKDYKVDAFRFDLLGFHPKAQVEEALRDVRKINPDVFFYAEGWDFGETAKNRRFVTATQLNLAGSGISTYSDRLRDAARGGRPFDVGEQIRETQGFGNGAFVLSNEKNAVSKETALHQSDLVRLGMAGNLKDFVLIGFDGVARNGSDFDYSGAPAGYAKDPFEVVNYVSKHDNQSLWDNNSYKVADDTPMEVRVRMQALSLATALLGQGIAFTDIGSDFLRSKSFERDSYDSGDWYNWVDYSLHDNNFGKGYPRADKDQDNYGVIERALAHSPVPAPKDLRRMSGYFKELTMLRKSSPLFTLMSGEAVKQRVDFRNVGPEQTPGLIVMTIDDGIGAGRDLDPTRDGLVVVLNASPKLQSVGDFRDEQGDLLALEDFRLLNVLHGKEMSLSRGAAFVAGRFSVPAWSVAVFEKPQRNRQGRGLPVSKK